MITLTLFQISSLITAAVSLFLGLLVYLSGEKNKLNFSWLLTSIFIALWSIGLFAVVFSSSITSTWLWQYVLALGAICIPILFLNFILYLTKKEKKLVTLQVFSLVAGTALIILNFPEFKISYLAGYEKSYFVFPFYFTIFMAISAFVIMRESRLAKDPYQKKQLMYILFAQIFGIIGGFINFFPQLFNIYPFGNYLIILYVVFVSYAAFPQRFFDIKVIAVELFTFALWVLLSIKIFFSASLLDLVLNIAVFIFVLLFGLILIKNVLKESRQREKMEKMAMQIKKAYEVEKKANEELAALDNIKNQFLMTIQHHLKTPLTSMRGYADLLLEGAFGKMPLKIEEVVKKFEISTTKLIKMVNDFLDITQFQLGKKTVSLKEGVDLSLILEEIVKDIELQARGKGIYLKLEKPTGQYLVKADELKLKAALVNVFDNAVKYTEQGGVTIMLNSKFQIPNSKILITVKDTGRGIAEERLPKLFDSAFERVEAVKKDSSQGRGLGLYLASQIVRAHNGRIWVESEGEGKGSTFYIELPAG